MVAQLLFQVLLGGFGNELVPLEFQDLLQEELGTLLPFLSLLFALFLFELLLLQAFSDKQCHSLLWLHALLVADAQVLRVEGYQLPHIEVYLLHDVFGLLQLQLLYQGPYGVQLDLVYHLGVLPDVLSQNRQCLVDTTLLQQSLDLYLKRYFVEEYEFFSRESEYSSVRHTAAAWQCHRLDCYELFGIVSIEYLHHPLEQHEAEVGGYRHIHHRLLSAQYARISFFGCCVRRHKDTDAVLEEQNFITVSNLEKRVVLH